MAAKKTSDAAAAAAEAAMALELETAAVAVASIEAQQEAEAAAVRLQKQQQEEDELDVVAVGAVAHVIRRAFHTFYAYPEAEDHTTDASDADAATLADFEPLQVSEGPVEGSKQDEAQAQDKSPQDEPQVQEKVEE
uniref:Uncharacterized protein n=2 Tax=Phytophthora ramorum TaxID=164328 RepID=H3H4E8_PHYRM